jgi:hypothetical protein
MRQQNVILRWFLAIIFLALITNSFTGSFSNLSIQIADAPNLAGLVVNLETFNGVAVTMALSLCVFASFPKYTKWTFILLLPFSMVAAGWQIQDQYIGFRGFPSDADIAGQFVAETLTEVEKQQIHIIASSRFDATNAALWIDKPGLDYDLAEPGATIDSDWMPTESTWILALDDITVQGSIIETRAGQGFTLYKIR